MEGRIISVLGATGSVGMQAIDVARSRGYHVDILYSNKSSEAMETLARELKPTYAIMADDNAARDLALRLSDTDVRVDSGEDALGDALLSSPTETVINAVSGFAGLRPTLDIIDSGKRLALANKESLVVAGDIVISRAKGRGVEILPVDSEHCAIFQSLKSGRACEIKRILLTASGGPFRDKTIEELSRVTLAETLLHPTWKMGKKITVDSATLMNKGFEVIEAVHLFGVSPSDIEVVVHRESILHSAVEYIDNSIIGEFSVPDMRMCVQYAVDYPKREVGASPALDLAALGRLSFEAPRLDAFPLLALAYRAAADGGAMGAVLNAADEIAVDAFLGERIGYSDIYSVVAETYGRLESYKSEITLDSILAADAEARRVAEEITAKI